MPNTSPLQSIRLATSFHSPKSKISPLSEINRTLFERQVAGFNFVIFHGNAPVGTLIGRTSLMSPHASSLRKARELISLSDELFLDSIDEMSAQFLCTLPIEQIKDLFKKANLLLDGPAIAEGAPLHDHFKSALAAKNLCHPIQELVNAASQEKKTVSWLLPSKEMEELFIQRFRLRRLSDLLLQIDEIRTHQEGDLQTDWYRRHSSIIYPPHTQQELQSRIIYILEKARLTGSTPCISVASQLLFTPPYLLKTLNLHPFHLVHRPTLKG